MASGGGDWPPSLRYVTHASHSEFASSAFAQATDANRQQVSDELKRLIFAAFQDGSLHTRDWRQVRLASLTPGGTKRPADAMHAAAPPLPARWRRIPTCC